MRAKKRMHGTVVSPAAAQARLSTTPPTVAVSMTVGEIADALREIEPDTATLIERIRNWTKQRILAPTDNAGAGTGKHIRYAREIAPYEVLLLNALTRAGYVAGRSYVVTALNRLREELPKWRTAHRTKSTPSLFLVITHPIRGSHRSEPKADIVTKITPDPKAETMVIVNLGELFARVGGSL
jgi:hypothetical protein